MILVGCSSWLPPAMYWALQVNYILKSKPCDKFVSCGLSVPLSLFYLFQRPPYFIHIRLYILKQVIYPGLFIYIQVLN